MKKLSIKTIMILLTVGLIVAISSCQMPGLESVKSDVENLQEDMETIQDQVAQLQHDLGLTNTQVDAIWNVLDNYDSRIDDLEETTGLNATQIAALQEMDLLTKADLEELAEDYGFTAIQVAAIQAALGTTQSELEAISIQLGLTMDQVDAIEDILAMAEEAATINDLKDTQINLVYFPAIERVRGLQADDGSWDWVVTDAFGPTGTTYLNIAGVTGMSLIQAYELNGNPRDLNDAIDTGNYLVAHYSAADLTAERLNAFNMVFLAKLSEVTGDSQYEVYAEAMLNTTLSGNNAWNNMYGDFDSLPGYSAHDLYSALANYRSGNEDLHLWDLCMFVVAGQVFDETDFAEDLVTEMETYAATMTDDEDDYYALALAALVIATEAAEMDSTDALSMLIASQETDGSFDGSVQTTAYAIMALESAGMEDSSITKGAIKYLIHNFGYNTSVSPNPINGWLDEGAEYAEVDSEAAYALGLFVNPNTLYKSVITVPVFTSNAVSGQKVTGTPANPLK